MLQFLGESVYHVFSFAVAIIGCAAYCCHHTTPVDKKLFIDYASKESGSIGWLLFWHGVIAGTTLLLPFGIPAVKVLKANHHRQGASLPRKVLVTLQFGFPSC